MSMDAPCEALGLIYVTLRKFTRIYRTLIVDLFPFYANANDRNQRPKPRSRYKTSKSAFVQGIIGYRLIPTPLLPSWDLRLTRCGYVQALWHRKCL